MFLSSWLVSFQAALQLTSRRTRLQRSRRHASSHRSSSVERLECRTLLTPPIITPTNRPGGGKGNGSSPPYTISHDSTFSGEPNGLDGSEIAVQLRDIDFPADTPISIISAISNDTSILHSVDNPASPFLTFRNELGNPGGGGGFGSQLGYIQFSPGSALFGSTTITVTAVDNAGEFASIDIPVSLNDAPSFGALTDISAYEDSPPISVHLSQITAGGGADDPSGGGQHRLMYASSTNLLLTGIPLITYDTASMAKFGTLKFTPTPGAPVAITTTGDNQAFITVTIEDAGPDNIIGKTYDPVTGDVTITNFNATLDNLRRSRMFQFTVIPVNDDPTVDTADKLAEDATINQTTITLANAFSFPTTAPFIVQVESERMLVTSVSGNTFTVTRAFDGTAAATHAKGKSVSKFDIISFSEDAAGPLSANVTNSQTTITFANAGNAALFTQPVPFNVQVDSEQMLVTAVDIGTNSFTVTRGVNGTVAAAHNQGAIVYPSLTLTGITPGGGTSVLGNELQEVTVNPATTNAGTFTLTFNNGTHPYTTDPIAFNAPLVTSVDETLRITANANGGSFTLSFANNLGAVTSLYDAVDNNPATTTIYVDDLVGFPTAPFVIAVNAEEMYVSAVTPDSVPGNPNRARLTVVREWHGTTAAAHSADATVVEVRTSTLNGAITALTPAGAASVTTASMSNSQVTFQVTNVANFAAASSTLFADVLPSDISIQLPSTAVAFSTLPVPFQIAVNGELMTVTNVTYDGVNPTVLDVDRANPSASTHNSGSTVRQTVTIRVDRELMYVTAVSGPTLTVVRNVDPLTGIPDPSGIGAAHGIRAVTRVDDVITVEDSTMFPVTVPLTPFEIRIDSEDLLVTYVDVVTHQMHVIRGIHGTNIVAHLDGARVSPLETTGPIAHNAAAIEVQTALEGLPNIFPGDVVVTGGPIGPSTPVTVAFAGRLARLNIDNLTADRGGLIGDEVQTLAFNGPFSVNAGGTFTVSFGGTSTAIPFNADANTFRTILENSPAMNINPGDLIVTGGPINVAPLTIQYTGQYANTNVTQMTVNSSPAVNPLVNDEQQLITFTGSPTGGTFRLTYTNASGTNFNTGVIPYDPTPGNTRDNIETALQGLTTPLVVDVDVVELSSTQWLVTFRDVADYNHNQLTVFNNSLTPSSGIQITTLENGNTGIGFTTATPGFSPTTSIIELTPGSLSLFDALEGIPSLTAADIQITGTNLPAGPATVAFIGAYAGLDVAQMTTNPLPTPTTGLRSQSQLAANIVIASTSLNVLSAASFPTTPGFNIRVDNEEMTVTAIAGTTFTVTRGVNGTTPADHFAGAAVVASSAAVVATNPLRQFDGEVQELAVLAVSNNPDIVPHPIVNYTSARSFASLTLTNLSDKFGVADITVTIIDSGFDQKLSTTSDNGVTIKTFRVTVNPVNDLPTINALPDRSVPKNSGALQINLSGITAGGGETQDLKVEAFSSNGTLIPNPVIQYTPGSTTGTLSLQPQFGQAGFANIEVRITDAGLDGSLNATADNGVKSIFFRVDVSESPTLDATPTSFTINEGDSAATATRTLTGITAGASETSQNVRITFTHTNPTLIPNPTITPNQFGSPTTSADFVFQPTPKLSGTDNFVFTITDAGPDDILGINSVLNLSIGANDTVLEIQPGTQTNFPNTTPFKIRIGSEHLLVTAANLAFPYRYTVVRGVDGTTKAAHAGGATVVHPNAFDNLTITRNITVIVNPVNDLPTLADFNPGTNPNPPLTIPESSGLQIVSVSGISDGEAPGPSQPLSLTVTGNTNPGLTGAITVEYSGGSTGKLKFTPTPGQFGTAQLTITVTDGGLDGNLVTTGDNAQVSKTLDIFVVALEDLPTLGPIANRTILEDSGTQIVRLTDISDGDDGTQELQVTATSDNPGLIPNPTVTNTPASGSLANPLSGSATTLTLVSAASFPPNSQVPYKIQIGGEILKVTAVSGNTFTVQRAQAGTTATTHGSGATVTLLDTYFLTFAPNQDQFGTATITVTVTDGGADTMISTPNDNVPFSRTFTVTVNPVNDAPRVTAPPTTLSIPESASVQTINLTGIDAGPSESQALSISVTSDNTGLIPNPTVSYTSPNSTATINYQPAAFKTGTAKLTIKIMDAGLDGILDTLSDNATTTHVITVTVNAVNDAPTLNAIPTPLGTLAAAVTSTIATSISVNNLAAFPSTATPNFTIQIEDERMTVTQISGSTFTVIRGVQGTAAATHTINQEITPLFQLAQAVTSTTATTITLNNVLGFPTSGTPNFTIQVDNEQMTVTGVSGKTFTVIRKANGTTAATHAAGANVTKLILEDSGENTIALSGITAGPFESQVLKVTPSLEAESVTGLITNLSVVYASPNATGSLKFTPGANLFGTATIRVSVEDAGFDGVLGFDFLAADIVARPSNTPDAITVRNASAFPQNVTPGYKLTVGTEVMLVTGISGNTFAVTRGIDATTAVAHSAGARVNHSTANDNGTFFRNYAVTITNVTDLPTLAQPGNVVYIEGTPSEIYIDGVYDNSSDVIPLSGISDGDLNTQALTIIASNDNPALFNSPDIPVIFTQTPAAGTVSTAMQSAQLDLSTVIQASTSGTALIKVVVMDAGVDGITGTFGALAADVGVFTNGLVTLEDATGFPGTATPNFSIKIDNELMTVIGISGTTLTVTRTAPVAHSKGAIVLQGTSLDNALVTKTFNLQVASIASNDPPTLDPILLPASTLSEAVTSLTATTVKVANPAQFPATASVDQPFTIKIGSEQMTVTGISGNDFTVVRKANGTTASTHSINAAVTRVFYEDDAAPIRVDLTGITAGPGASEAGQTLMITIVSDNEDLIPNPNPLGPGLLGPNESFDLVPEPNASGEVTITVTVTDDDTIDGIVQSIVRTFKVTLNAVNDAPTLASESIDLDENTANGTTVLALDFEDIDTPTNQLAFRILSGNTGGAFSIDANGNLKVANAAALDFEKNPSFSLQVEVTDNSPVLPTGQSVTATITVNLNDLDESLIINSTTWVGTAGLTLVVIQDSFGDDRLHVRITNTTTDVLPAHLLAKVTDVQVTGRLNFGDILTLDYSGGAPVPGGLVFNGDTGPNDTLRFVNASSEQFDVIFTSANTATLTDGASNPMELTDVEILKFEASVTNTDLNFTFLPDDEELQDDNVTFSDDAINSNDLSRFSSSTSLTVVFPTLSGNLSLDLGDGNDIVTFTSIEDATAGPAITVLGGTGNDRLDASAVARRVDFSGSEGNDSLIGGGGNDTLDGGDDDDVLSGGLGNDSIDGGGDEDTLYESTNVSLLTLEDTSLSGGLGNDDLDSIEKAIFVGGSSGNEFDASLFTGSVTLNGGGGNDTLRGGTGDENVFTGGAGNDTIVGNAGAASNKLVESGNTNFTLTDTSLTGLGTDQLSQITEAFLTGGTSNNVIDAAGFTGDVTLDGGDGNDILVGGSGTDSLIGGAGNDTLTGGAGSDRLDGGAGTDMLFESGDGLFVLKPAELNHDGDTDVLISIETAWLEGGDGEDELDASTFTGKTTLRGGGGNDVLYGGLGADSLDGGAGDDFLTGGLGNDSINGGGDFDTLVESGKTLTLTPTKLTGVGTDVLTSIEAAILIGTAGNDKISGSTFAGPMEIYGGLGNDSLTGGKGNDTIDGDAGNDTINGGNGDDVLLGGDHNDKMTGGDGVDSMDGGDGHDNMSGQGGNDVMLGGEGNDTLSGGNDHDAIDGQGGNDKITGDNGNDTLIGGTGKDSINGGAGNDLLWSGDYASNSVNPSDGEKDTLVSGTGSDTIRGESGLDVTTDKSNTSGEFTALFTFDYGSIFDGLLNF